MKTSTLSLLTLTFFMASACDFADEQDAANDASMALTALNTKAADDGRNFRVNNTEAIEPTSAGLIQPRLSPAQDCRNPPKMPFRMAEGLQAAGYGLNTNDDGIENFGELAVDCGGAGATSCIDVPLKPHIESDVLLDPDLYAGYRIHHIKGTLNGRHFEMLRPEPDQQGLTRDNVGLVIEHPSRWGNHHGPPIPYTLSTLVPGQGKGATAIAMQGVTGGHPYTFSAQEAVLASRYLREKLDLDTIVVSGASYGAAASLVDASAYPEHFDGVVAMAAPYNGRAFVAWSEMGALRGMAADLFVFDPLYYPGLDGMTMAAEQAGLAIENLDITRLENAHVPAIIIVGEADHVWLPGTRVAEDQARMAAEGLDWVDLRVIPEAQHGGPEMNQAVLLAYEELYTRIDTLRQDGFVKKPALCASPRQRDTTYDAVLRSAPPIQPHARVSELWSDVTLLEPGNAGHSVVVEGSAVFTGSVQGFVIRRDVKNGVAMQAWATPVGRAVQALAVIDGHLVVGSKRGIAVLDAASGALIRETTGIGSVTDLVLADLIANEPGLEIAARADMDMLHVESLADGALLSSTTVGSGGAMAWSNVLGEGSLLLPMQRGHIVAFRFIADGEQGWIPEAQWLSDYLAHDAAFVYPSTWLGEPVMLVAGSNYGGTIAALLIGIDGTILHEIALPMWSVQTVAAWFEGEILMAGIGGVIRIDLAAGTATPWLGNASVVASMTTGSSDADGLALLWNHGFGAFPSFRMVDRNGMLKHIEHGRATTPALDVYMDNDMSFPELSVMNRAWNIERFNLHTGAVLGSVAWPKPEGAILSPRRLVRTGSAAETESYAPFLSDGDMLTQNIRVATRCGGWIATTSIAEEQGHLAHNGDTHQQSCASSEWGALLPPSTGFSIRSERIGSTSGEHGQQTGALRFVDISGPHSHAIMSTAGGQLALYSATQAAGSGDIPVAPEKVVDVGGTITSLAVGQDLDAPIIALGSWLAAEDGGTLHLLSAPSLEVRAVIEAGPVLGVAMADINRDGSDEILVGTQDGYLRAFNLQGLKVLEWAAGDFQLAENGAIFAYDDGEKIVVAFAVAGGFRVLAIASE
ncbi:MAG: hypothetical protein QGI45_15315 [Myxococcota bacterium]|nr:hypothetical protein [Myxococcota bacterium]